MVMTLSIQTLMMMMMKWVILLFMRKIRFNIHYFIHLLPPNERVAQMMFDN